MEKKTIKGIFISIVAVLVTIVIIFIAKKTENAGGESREKMHGKGGGRSGAVVTVRSVVSEVGTLRDYVTTNGEVESQSAIEVFPSMSGKIKTVSVMLGSHVNKGDVIAKVDPSEPGSRYALSPVDCPISGSIVSSPLKVGTKVSTTTPITMIGDIENLQITAPIPERYVAELKPGLRAEVTLEAYPNVIFQAFITRVSPVVDAATRTKEIILNFDEKDSRVNAGMFAKIKLYTSEYSERIIIPKDALVINGDESYLFVVTGSGENATVTRKTVKLGKTVDNDVQILEGIREKERVVVEGMLSLSEGAKVNDIAR